MSWIPFHSSLREGDKRGLPRAVRFVFLELSLLTRPTGGRLPLPRGFKSDLDAVHDMLGGDRREVRAALDLLTVPLDPTDPEDMPLVLVSGPPERRILEIPSHRRWVRPDTTAVRVRRHRERHSQSNREDADDCNAFDDVTETDAPVTDVTGQRRGEERKEKESKGNTAADASPAGSTEPTITDPPSTKPQTLPLVLEPGSSPAKSPEADVFEHWVQGWKRIVKGTRVPTLDDKRRGKIRARLREKFSVADLKRAIDGMWSTPWNVENKFWDIELVCRDSSHVERFIARAADSAGDEDPVDEPKPVYGPPAPAPPGLLERVRAFSGKPMSPFDSADDDTRPGADIRLPSKAGGSS